jgi:hypothetical protein
MSLLPKTVAALASAALLVAAPAVAASAHPAAHEHGTHHHATHVHKHAGPADKLAGLRRGATHAVAAQVRGIQALVNEAASLDIADASALQGALGLDLATAQDDQVAVAQAESRADLHALMRAALTTRQVAGFQFRAVVAADEDAAEAADLTGVAESLMGQVADRPGTADAQAALEEALGLLATAGTQASGVAQYVVQLSPTETRSELHAAAHNVHLALDSISEMLDTASSKIDQVEADFGA